ncbi:MAG: ADP-glyceromanno-heptose 6-epimerase [Cyclobacteriaceae bacterium]|nr:ADP-glyceromanno-heptose 6-epimerase [Cyclobacteriaceae bacterium]
MIVVTGAAGFIGSCLIKKLNDEGHKKVVAVDDFQFVAKEENLKGKDIGKKVEREAFFKWLDSHHEEVEFIFHIGARTDTTEFNQELFDVLNINYTKSMWKKCTDYKIPLVYASSAATYGDGDQGYDDNEATMHLLKPLNPYGMSKHVVDLWILEQKEAPPFWAGLKFFNVYGPNEYHKGRMASVVFHAFNQIREKESMNLFRSHNPSYKDGEQMRDFIYVKDVLDVCNWLMKNQKKSGIYNLGSGKARTFYDLVSAVFDALEKKRNIGFIDTPEDIRDKYQYFTQSEMGKLKSSGYNKPFYSLEEGIEDYVREYLVRGKYY